MDYDTVIATRDGAPPEWEMPPKFDDQIKPLMKQFAADYTEHLQKNGGAYDYTKHLILLELNEKARLKHARLVEWRQAALEVHRSHWNNVAISFRMQDDEFTFKDIADRIEKGEKLDSLCMRERFSIKTVFDTYISDFCASDGTTRELTLADVPFIRRQQASRHAAYLRHLVPIDEPRLFSADPPDSFVYTPDPIKEDYTQCIVVKTLIVVDKEITHTHIRNLAASSAVHIFEVMRHGEGDWIFNVSERTAEPKFGEIVRNNYTLENATRDKRDIYLEADLINYYMLVREIATGKTLNHTIKYHGYPTSSGHIPFAECTGPRDKNGICTCQHLSNQDGAKIANKAKLYQHNEEDWPNPLEHLRYVEIAINVYRRPVDDY